MRARFLFLVAAMATVTLFMAGCGGDNNPPPVTGVSRGVVTSVGNSVTVNGVDFSTTGAAITMDDPADATTLKAGMVVTVRGQFTDAIRGTAFEVKMANDLKGPVTAAFNNLSSTMTVLGQRVRIDPASTVFDNFSGGSTSSTARIAAGQMVRISGFSDPNGGIHATFVQRKLPNWAAATPVTIRGAVTSMPTSTTLTIGGLTVTGTIPAGTAVGSFVKVVGTIPTLASTALTATSIQLLQMGLDNEAGVGARADAEGFVTNLSGSTFKVGGTTIDAGGLSLTGITDGMKVEVEGTIGSGKILATKVIVDDPSYLQANLVSNIPGIAATTDANLVNSWGIAHSPTGAWWVNDNGTGVTTVYDGLGVPFPSATPTVVTIPLPTPSGGATAATPTGIVFNNFSGFDTTPGNATTSARFIFVTEDGTISAWSSGTTAVRMVNNPVFPSDTGPVFKGAALATNGSVNRLYVANFRAGTVDVFDSTFAPVTLPTTPTGAPFTVPAPHTAPPAGYHPFNVANIGGKLYVTYALLNTVTLLDDVPGQGHGFVEVFNPDGSFVMSLQNGLWFNSPWGVTMAPADFGKFSNMLLVGNFGSGQIAAFEPVTGTFMGLLRDSSDQPVVIDGLWGLGFGNGGTAGPINTLFFAAGLNAESDGLFGTLTPQPHVEQNE